MICLLRYRYALRSCCPVNGCYNYMPYVLAAVSHQIINCTDKSCYPVINLNRPRHRDC